MPPSAVSYLKPVPNPPDQLEGLFQEHADKIIRVAYRITGSLGDAEDVLQTVFLRLARRKGDVGVLPNAWSYLHRAAINGALDLVRRRKWASAVHLEGSSAQLIESPSPGPEAQHRDRELQGLIRRAVAALGSKTAEMFVLRYFEGFGNREIAQMMGTSPMVVAVVLHRARRQVRQEIGKLLEGHYEANERRPG